MSKLSLEHTIRNIAEGKIEPSNEKLSLEHTIRNIAEGIGTGTDKFQGSQFKTVRTVTPVIKPGHNERSETASNARNAAKAKESLTMQNKVSESVPDYGNAASVAQWPASESGCDKKKKKIKEESSEGTEERRKVDAMGRPDTAKDPRDEKSKIYKQGQIKTKIIDEEKKEKIKLEGGKTPIDLKPKIKDPKVDSGGNVKEDIDLDEGLKDKVKKAGKVAGVIGSMAGPAYDAHYIATHPHDVGYATTAAASYAAPPIKLTKVAANMIPSALKVNQANKGEDEKERQKKFIRTTPTMKKEETEMDKEILEAFLEMNDISIEELSDFGKAFSAAKGKTFTFKGKSYSGKKAESKPAASSTPTPPKKPESVGLPRISDAPAHSQASTPQAASAAAKSKETSAPTPPKRPESVSPQPGKPDGTSTKSFLSKELSTEGGKKKVKEEVDNPLIAAFLALQGDKSGNMFEAAKKLSPKQKKIAAVAGDKEKIDADDFKALRGGKKVEEEVEQIDELSKKTLKSYQKKANTSAERSWAKADKEEDKSMATDGTKYPEKQERHMKNAAKAVAIWGKRQAGLKMVAKKLAKEEVGFSESELEFFNSVMEAEPVAKTDATAKMRKSHGNEPGVADTVPTRDLTN